MACWTRQAVLVVGLLGLCVQQAFPISHRSSLTQARDVYERLVVNKETDRVYGAGTNLLLANYYPKSSYGYVGDRNLILAVNRSSPDCAATNSCQGDAYTKGLAIDYVNQQLITCWSFPQGHCQKRNLSNIEEVEEVDLPIVPSDNTSSSIVLVADGPGGDPALYIAATRSSKGSAEVKDRVPPISVRNLGSFQPLTAIDGSALKLQFLEAKQDTYKVYYVYGFSHKGFVYFLTNQRDNYGRFNPKLVRVCGKAENLTSSYAELPLKCHPSVQDNMATSAYYYNGSGSCGSDESTLLVATSVSVGDPPLPSDGSSVCRFQMRDVEEAFREATQACFKGFGNIGPPHVTSPRPCKKTDISIPLDYCGTHEFNSPVDGETPLREQPYASSEDETYTAVAAMETKGHMVTFIGTKEGKIYMFGGTTKPCGTYQIEKAEDTVIKQGSQGNEVTMTTKKSQPVRQIGIGRGNTQGEIFVLTPKGFWRLEAEAEKLCTFLEKPVCGLASGPPGLYSLVVLLCLLCARIFI